LLIITMQGGIDGITQALAEEIQSVDSQIVIDYEPPAPIYQPVEKFVKGQSGLLPPAEITPASSGKRYG